jgi:hypothetical protein
VSISESELVAQAALLLAPHFDLLSEVRLRDPLTAIDLRIDFLAWPKDPEFPFDMCGLEIKRPALGREYVAALKQAIDYRRAVVVDSRCADWVGCAPGAVFLFHGGETEAEGGHASHYGAIRLAGRFNVGELALHPWDGPRLEIARAPIWSAHNGTTGTGVAWPRERRVGNGRRRAA